jgi:glucan phosphoethanolaminetransferase (alkaline phosphatase superfamily)
MLQRFQTLFLAIIVVSMGIMMAMPLWEKTALDDSQSLQLTALRLTHQQGTSANITPVWYVAMLGAIVAGIAAFAIFQYRNRLRQALLCGINSLVMTVLMGVLMYLIFGQSKDLFEPENTGGFGYGFYALVVAMLSNVLANRFIRRDEKFVKSQDRFR